MGIPMPSVEEIIKKNPNRIQEVVDAGRKRLLDEHMFKYGRTPRPGDKYELCAWEFMDRNKLTQQMMEEVMQKLMDELISHGYEVTKGDYHHQNIYGQTYATSPKLIIGVPLS